MSTTYAIADLHDRFDLLELALAEIADHAELPATLVTLGDYVDRGPESRQVIERLILGKKNNRTTLRISRARHDYEVELARRPRNIENLP
jgi:serine/threonine protein phosphatase 1